MATTSPSPGSGRRSSVFSDNVSSSSPAAATTPQRTSGSWKAYLPTVIVGAIFVGVIALTLTNNEVQNLVGPNLVSWGLMSNDIPLPHEVTSHLDGDVLTAQMVSYAPQWQLRNQVMEEIYALAQSNYCAHKLVLTVQVPGKDDAIVQIDDLNDVRTYQSKEFYASTTHRIFVGSRLLAANQITETAQEAPTLVTTNDINADLIGRTFTSALPSAHGFGVKFISETQAQIFSDGKMLGVSNYTTSGDSVTLSLSNAMTTMNNVSGILASVNGSAPPGAPINTENPFTSTNSANTSGNPFAMPTTSGTSTPPDASGAASTAASLVHSFSTNFTSANGVPLPTYQNAMILKKQGNDLVNSLFGSLQPQ